MNYTARDLTEEEKQEIEAESTKEQEVANYINQQTALPMPESGSKIPLQDGGYAWVDPKLSNKPVPEYQPSRDVTMDDMLTDIETFKYFKEKGAFDSESEWYEMLWDGLSHMASDTGEWLATTPQRIGVNFLEDNRFNKKLKAEAQAHTLQVVGDMGLNYKTLKEGAGRLWDKIHIDEDKRPQADLKSSYKFWKSINEVEKKRKTIASELALNDFLMMGGDPEVRRLIAEGEVKPNFSSSMGASIWADPLNYISLGAGYQALKGGSNVAFRGAERGMVRELSDAMIFKAQLDEVAKASPSQATDKAIRSVDGFILENLDKLNQIAPKRDIALREYASQLPVGHPLREKIEDSLKGIDIKAKSNITSKIVGGAMVGGGKAVETVGSFFEFVSRLPQETAINALMKVGISEDVATTLAKDGVLNKFAKGAVGAGTLYGAVSMLTDDELIATSASIAFLAPQLLKRYGRDTAIMGRELMNPETILPYWKRMSANGAETLTDRIIDRQVLFPVKSTMEAVTGAGAGKVGQRLKSVDGQKLAGTKSGGLYDLANTLDKSKVGRYLELGGKVADGTAKGGAIGGAFGFVAGGGEQEEAFWGGVGAGGALGGFGATIGGAGKMRGFSSPTELIQARYGSHQYFVKNLLPPAQKDAFSQLPKEAQIAWATSAMSHRNTEYRFKKGDKDGLGGEQGMEDGNYYVEVNVNSPWAIDFLVQHELTHYIEQVGGSQAFNDMLIGNQLLGLKGYFTKLDGEGNPIKKSNGDGLVPTQGFEDLKFKYFKRFKEYDDVYQQKFDEARSLGKTNEESVGYAKRKVLNKLNKIKGIDERTVREVVAEHGVDFFSHDKRRYKDLREGTVGALFRSVIESPILNNKQFLKTTLAKLGATFRADGQLMSPNFLFGKMERIPQVTELVRKYNRQMEGLSSDQMNKKFPASDAEKTVVDITGAEFAKSPELIELLRAGTFMKVDADGNIVPNKAMTPAEQKKYNLDFGTAILKQVEKLDADEGLPQGHIVGKTNEKTGEVSFAGRYIDERIIDIISQQGGWNKSQVELLRGINNSLKNGENEIGGTDWLLSTFKATNRGGSKYLNARVQHEPHIPYGIEITQKGNIIIRTINQLALERNVNKAFKQHTGEVTRLYGADLEVAYDLFKNDMHKYHLNHAENKAGHTGLDANPTLAKEKANFINAMFGKSSKAHADSNPWLTQVDGTRKSPTPTYRSPRLERIGNATQLTGKNHVDHAMISKNLMPEFQYVPAEFTGTNPQKSAPYLKDFDITKFEQGGKFFDRETKVDITDKTYEGMSIDTVNGNRPNAKTSDTISTLPQGHSSKVGSLVKVNMVNGKQGQTKFKWLDSKSKWDTKRQANESWLVSIESSALKGNGRKTPKGGKDTDHVFARELINEVPTKLATYPKSESNPRGRPTSKGDIVTGNVVGTMKMGKYKHFVYDKVRVVPKDSDAKNMPQFKGASDEIPNIINDIDVATSIFGKVPNLGHAYDRSWHINTLVKRVLGNANPELINSQINRARKSNRSERVAKLENKLSKSDEYYNYLKYPLRDLVASLPELKSQDLKKNLNSAKVDPFEPIRDAFPDGQKRPIESILGEMSAIHNKYYPDALATHNEIRGMGEILKDDYGVEIKQEFLDDLYRKSRGMTKEEHAQFKVEEQKTLNELFNPEFNDVKDLGGGSKLIKPIDPDKNYMPPTSPEFKNWFGDSKVIDENGKPLVVYHGTDNQFSEFKTPSYFTNDPSVASDFATMFVDAPYHEKPKGNNVKPVYLSIKNPKEIKSFDAYEGLFTDLNPSDPRVKKLKDQGHDGLTYKGELEGDPTYHVAFDPTQIKSATGNKGTFDSSNPDIRHMPSAERKPVTFSARPEEIVTLDSENLRNFMPAHKNVRIEDYADTRMMSLASDKAGVGGMFVGQEGNKRKIPIDAQGGRGFMYIYENGGWSFSKEGTANTFLGRVAEVADGKDHVIVGISVLGDLNHLNSVFGQFSIASAYEGALKDGVSREQMSDHLQTIMGKVSDQKYGKDVFYKSAIPKKGIKKGQIKHKKGSYKLPDHKRKTLTDIKDVDSYKSAILDRKLDFDLTASIVERGKGKTLPIKEAQAKELGVDMRSIAESIADPELMGLPVGQVVALLKVPVNQKPVKADFHLSYPYSISGEAIGFLDQTKALKDLTSNEKVFNSKTGAVGGQPLQTVMPVFDKLNPSLYMPNFKPMLQGKVDNIRGLALPKIKQDKFSPSQLMAKINETKGAKEFAEDIGLNAFLEGKKSVTKKDVDDFITDKGRSIILFQTTGTESYKDVQMLGGDYFNYTESVYELPKTDLYMGGDISGGHFDSDRTLMHSRVTRRTLDDGDGGNTEMIPTHHIEEMQSDWHQRGRQDGYADAVKIREVFEVELGLEKLRKEREETVTKAIEKYRPEVEQFFSDRKTEIYDFLQKISKFSGHNQAPLYTTSTIKHDIKPKFDEIESRLNNFFSFLNAERQKIKRSQESTNNLPLVKKYQDLTATLEFELNPLMDGFTDLRTKVIKDVNSNATAKLDEKISRLEKIAEKVEQQIESGEFGQSPAPFKNSWQGRILTDEIQKAVENGDKYLSWNTGEMSAKMANLDQNFKSVEVRYTKSDFINKDGSNLYAVTATKNEGGTIKRSTDAKGLQGLVGKDYSKEAITRLEKNNVVSWMNKVELTDIVVPHTGRRILYDKVVVDVAKRMAKIMGTRPPMKSKVILKRNAVVPERGGKAKAETAEVWVMELPESSEKLSQLPLYMPSMMPMKKMPSVTSPLGLLNPSKPTGFEFKAKTSRASQARDLEPDNPYFK